jgi:integrase/recombinase XerD
MRTEFKRGQPEARHDRPICPRCFWRGSAKKEEYGTKRCPKCGGPTKPRFRVTWREGDKKRKQGTDTWKLDEAAEVLRRIEEDYWRQQGLGTEREIGGTLKVALDAFKKAKVRDSHSEYAKQINSAMSALATGVDWDRQVHLIGQQDIENFRDDGLDARASTTIRSYMLVHRRFFRWIHEKGWVRHNPTVGVELPKAEARADCLYPNEVESVLAACWNHLSPTDAEVITALVLTGLRKGELVNQRWQHVDLERRWTYVLPFEGDALASAWSPKTDASKRGVPLHPLVIAARRKVGPILDLKGGESAWVYPVTDSRRKRRLTDKWGRLNPIRGDRRSPQTTYFGKRLRLVLDKVGITRNVTIHGLRRTFAVLLQETGAPDSVISQALGHRQATVTQRHYLPRRDEVVQRWVDSISLDVPVLTPWLPKGETPVFEVVEAERQCELDQSPPPTPKGNIWGVN